VRILVSCLLGALYTSPQYPTKGSTSLKSSLSLFTEPEMRFKRIIKSWFKMERAYGTGYSLDVDFSSLEHLKHPMKGE
jgi:hypothetical protein